MDHQEMKQELSSRLTQLRAKILKGHPFLGRLLLHLPFGFAPCGTTYTDMRRIVFDPEFASRLSDDELEFVLGHEIMHCILKHCTRGKGLNHLLYNIACDIVVNSTLLEMMGLSDYSVDKTEVMHLTINGAEGRIYTAEEIYYMLLQTSPDEIKKRYKGSGLDTHIIWEQLFDNGLNDVWESHIRAAAKQCGENSGIPYGLRRYLEDVERTPKTNWRQLLHDFIQYDRFDYSFSTPDRRYSDGVILPSFQENITGGKIENIWFVVDTSGSISDETLGSAYREIKSAAEQIGSLSGIISFFDTAVSDPVPFDSIDDLKDIEPVGGGGTNFHAVFRYLSENFEEMPNLIIIATDGYASFPNEDLALGTPVIWLIIDSNVTPPWGETIYITSYEQ